MNIEYWRNYTVIQQAYIIVFVLKYVCMCVKILLNAVKRVIEKRSY